jgi:hypothetical protein
MVFQGMDEDIERKSMGVERARRVKGWRTRKADTAYIVACRNIATNFADMDREARKVRLACAAQYTVALWRPCLSSAQDALGRQQGIQYFPACHARQLS